MAIPLDEDGQPDFDQLPRPEVANGKLVWKAPPDLGPHFTQLLRNSVAELNKQLTKGVRKLSRDGKVT
jgi:hypothetical protein